MSRYLDDASPDSHDLSVIEPAVREIPLSILAKSIRDAMECFKEHSRRMVGAACIVGQNLILAKQRVPHGEWETWLTENTPLAPRTAQNHMRLARKVEALPPGEALRVASLPVRDAIKLFTTSTDSKAAKDSTSAIEPGEYSEPTDTRNRFVDALQRMGEELNSVINEMSAHGDLDRVRLHTFKRALESVVAVIRDVERGAEEKRASAV